MVVDPHMALLFMISGVDKPCEHGRAFGLDEQLEHVRRQRRVHADATAMLRISGRIVQQIGQDLDQPVRSPSEMAPSSYSGMLRTWTDS